ncbi:MAG TPA: septal ring lytic transglycosylase RlpA family protein [Candidatus Saccharimonadia bacterium]|nr:septal ring lytic transglycosylase RlpA family protein [Candidatus Saccharimonadia bacterium]
MKAKTKRRVLHVLTKKKLVKRKTSKHVLRSFLVLLATVSMGSLAYGITLNKPIVGVSVHTSAAGGVQIQAPVIAGPPTPQPVGGPAAMTGRGSWYALGLPAPDSLTCASRTFPRGTYLLVKDLYNNNTVVCRVNDYGPEAWTGRIIDLSRGSFSAVDNLGRGTIPVELRVASGPTGGLSPTENDLVAVVGYSLCHKSHAGQFCEQHRQD